MQTYCTSNTETCVWKWPNERFWSFFCLIHFVPIIETFLCWCWEQATFSIDCRMTETETLFFAFLISHSHSIITCFVNASFNGRIFKHRNNLTMSRWVHGGCSERTSKKVWFFCLAYVCMNAVSVDSFYFRFYPSFTTRSRVTQEKRLNFNLINERETMVRMSFVFIFLKVLASRCCIV